MDLIQGNYSPMLDSSFKVNYGNMRLLHQQTVSPTFGATFTVHELYIDECGKCRHIVSSTRTSSTNEGPVRAGQEHGRPWKVERH